MIFRIGIMIFPLLCSVACSGAKELEYKDQRELPEGPGIFSRDDQGLVLIDTDRKKEEEKDAFREFEQWKRSRGGGNDLKDWMGSGEPQVSGESQEVLGPREGIAGSEEFKEYQEYKQWKEYQEFLEWKRKQQGK